MSCLLGFLLFDVFYGVYSGGVFSVSVFGDVVLLFVDTPGLYMVIYFMTHVLPRMNVSLSFHTLF